MRRPVLVSAVPAALLLAACSDLSQTVLSQDEAPALLRRAEALIGLLEMELTE